MYHLIPNGDFRNTQVLNFKMVAPKPRSVTPIIAWIRDFLGQVNPFLINAILVDSYDVSHYAEVPISWI